MPLGSPSPRSPLVLAQAFSSPLLADDLFLDSETLPPVLTATRLKQSPAAVPGSMTVIDSALISASGARDNSELLRLVPGMMGGNISGNQAAVNYHGTNATEARRMQVLIDGRSVYRAGLATVDWSDIPVAMEDIERIDDFYASQGVGLDDGFDSDRHGADYRDSRRLNRFNLAVSQTLDERKSIDWQLNAKEGSNQQLYTYHPVFSGTASSGNDSDINAKDYAGSLRWNLELQDTLSLSDSLRRVSDMNYRYDRADSETYFNGTLDDTTWRTFGQPEWRATEHWLLQGGVMFEDSQLIGSSLTPRVAVNYLINPSHGLRAVYSQAIRSPDMFENNVNWRYRVTHLPPAAYGRSSARYFVQTRGPGNLDQENRRSREPGYNGFFAEWGLAVDVKLFYDEITGMISEALRNNQYMASNSARFSGTETQLNWKIGNADRLHLGKTHSELTGVLQQRLDNQPTTFIDNNYDERRVMYFSAELAF